MSPFNFNPRLAKTLGPSSPPVHCAASPVAAPSDHTTARNTTLAGRRHRTGSEHITLDDGKPIDSAPIEIFQEPYNAGMDSEREAMRIDYHPRGFTPWKVLSDDLSEISEPHEIVFRRNGTPWPEKASFHLKFCNPDFEFPFRKQQRVKRGSAGAPTRATLAMFVSEGIQKALDMPEFSRFSWKLNEINVVSIDVRSRGTLQPRIFVGFATEAERQYQAVGGFCFI